jgi:hypothetical protein
MLGALLVSISRSNAAPLDSNRYAATPPQRDPAHARSSRAHHRPEVRPADAGRCRTPPPSSCPRARPGQRHPPASTIPPGGRAPFAGKATPDRGIERKLQFLQQYYAEFDHVIPEPRNSLDYRIGAPRGQDIDAPRDAITLPGDRMARQSWPGFVNKTGAGRVSRRKIPAILSDHPFPAKYPQRRAGFHDRSRFSADRATPNRLRS